MKIKIDTFQIFITILFILVLLIIIINFFKKSQGLTTENFQSVISSSKSIVMPQYSSTNLLTALDYNILFDELNGNVIITSIDFNTLQSNNYDGSDVKYIVLQRNGNYSVFDATPAEKSSNIQKVPNTINSSYNSWIFPNNSESIFDDFSLGSQIIYIPWGFDTYIQIIHQNGNSCIFDVSFYFGYGGARNVCSSPLCDSTNKILNPVFNFNDTNTNNNNYVIDTFYDISGTGYLFQLSNFVEFDIYSGNLVITQFDSASNQRNIVFNRIDGNLPGNNNTYTTPQQILNVNSTIPNNNLLNSWSIVDIDGNNMVTYMGMAQNTVVCISHKDPNDTKGITFKLVNVKRFDAYGNVIDGTGKSDNPKDKCANSDSQDYYKWYWYWYWMMNGNVPTDPNTPTKAPEQTCSPTKTPAPSCTPEPTYTPLVSNDYILKTQIVPPVCPSFPFDDYESDSDSEYEYDVVTPAPTTSAPTTSAPTTPAPTTHAPNNFIKDVDIPATPGIANLPSEMPILMGSSNMNSQNTNNRINNGYTYNNFNTSSTALKTQYQSNNYIPVTSDFSRFGR